MNFQRPKHAKVIRTFFVDAIYISNISGEVSNIFGQDLELVIMLVMVQRS